MTTKPVKVVFQRMAEPRENAFTLLVPEGWSIDGGIFRIDLASGSAQAASAKVDMVVRRDAAGSVMLRFLPSLYYWDPRGSVMPMPVGSNYQGMLVCPVLPPPQFLPQLVFPYAHQGQPVDQVEIVAQRDRPDVLEQYVRRWGPPPAGYSQAAGEVTYRYVEGGARYREEAHAIVQDMGPMAVGMWRNDDTWFLRAPDDEFERWEPVLRAVQASVKVNPTWAQEETYAQQIASGALRERQMAEQYRARRALQFQREMQAAAEEIVEHKRKTQAEIRNDQYLLMTSQEEYVNPYSGEVDLGSNQWTFRWVTSDGREFYTNDEGDNPNDDTHLRQWEWQRTPVRPRFPQ